MPNVTKKKSLVPSYASYIDPYDERVVLDEPVPDDVTEGRVLCVPEPAHAYLRTRLIERDQRRVRHHRVALRQLGIELVDHSERDATVERPLEATVVLRTHQVDVQRETALVLRRYV